MCGEGDRVSERILAIFTCFNRKELTERSVQTLVQNEKVQFDFVAVDDNSTDGTQEMLRGLPCRIDVVEGDGNLFWNGGMHRAIGHVKQHYRDYAYYMLMNDDTRFFPGIFDRLLEELDPDTVRVGAVTWETRQGLSYGGIKYTRGIRYQMCGPEEGDLSLDTFNANCVVVPHDIFMQVDMDPRYQHSMGDFDYGLQIRRLGYDIKLFSRYVGACDDNDPTGTWQDASLPRRERLRKKESRKGLPFADWFHFLYKNFGLGTAVVRSLTPYLKILLGK